MLARWAKNRDADVCIASRCVGLRANGLMFAWANLCPLGQKTMAADVSRFVANLFFFAIWETPICSLDSGGS